MDGVHDMGGMHGFGKVEPEQNEPVFHDDWERRLYALYRAMSYAGVWVIDQARFARERLPPAVYLASSYYRKWELRMETLVAELGKKLFHAQFPLSVIGTSEIDSRRQALAGKPGLVDDPHAGVAHRAIERVKASFPIIVKDGLVLLRLDFAEAVHAAHVVDTVHHATSLGALARPVPIMLSRVTRPANFSSLQPSVPVGRIGNTMKRVSAVESHTRIAVPTGSLTPKSANTPRGSFTARERYGADLYQTGGSPSTSHG